MTNLNLLVLKEVQKAFKESFGTDIDEKDVVIQPTRKEFEGSHTIVCFGLARFSKKNPEETGKVLGEYLKNQSEYFRDFNVVKGFLNLSLTYSTWLKLIAEISADDHFGYSEKSNKEIMVEYSSPNTNKPLHLGHLRNIFLGWSVSKLYEAIGYDVHKVQIINDRGIHICKSMIAWLKFGNGETPQSKGVKGDKFVGDYYVKFDQEYKKEIQHLMEGGMSSEEAEKSTAILGEAQDLLLKWEDKDPEVYSLWEKMNGWVYEGFNVTYDTMGVTFDKLYYESQTYLLGKDVIQKGLEKGVFYKKEDGSVWVDLTDEGLDEKLLLRSDGTSVYMTQDIGTAIMRFNEFPNIEKQVYTVGNEQEYHFKVLFLILAKLGYSWAKECYHLSYGMVDLPSGKMKSREGTVVDADELMDEVIEKAREKTMELGKIDEMDSEQSEKLFYSLGLGALKYYLLRVDPKKRMLFNPEESVDLQGNTGPFIQYTHARISSLLRKADERNIPYRDIQWEGITSLEATEQDLIYQISIFPQKIEEAAMEYSPSIVAQYVYDLSKEFNKFWQTIIILQEEDEELRKMRIIISGTVASIIRKSLNMLGIDAPNRM